MRTGATGAALREVNRSAVLRLVGLHGPISRAEIARRLGVSPGTVTAIARHLIDSGIVAAFEMAEPSGGRPAELLRLVGPAAIAIGAKIAHDHVAIVQADLDGTMSHSVTVPFDPASGNPLDTLVDLLAPHVERASRRGGTGRARPMFLGIGLGLPGFEDPYGSGVVQAPLLRWRNLPIGEHLARVLGTPVLVDNDVNTLAVAESLYGLGRGFDHFLTVTLGRGVGMGIVIGGGLYRGGRGAAGEFGHVSIGSDQPCTCGKRGCLEATIAEPALLALARRRRVIPAGGTPADLLCAADSGSRAALTIYADAGATLGRALADVAVVLNPQAILIAGEGSDAWVHMAAAFQAAFDDGAFPPVRGATAVHVEPWDDDSWALGAAALVLRAPFVAPMHEHPEIDAIRARLDAGVRARGTS